MTGSFWGLLASVAQGALAKAAAAAIKVVRRERAFFMGFSW
jgi:hypothetical protein